MRDVEVPEEVTGHRFAADLAGAIEAQIPGGPSHRLADALGPVSDAARDLARSMDRERSASFITDGLMDIVFPERVDDQTFREMLQRNAYDNIDTVWRIIAGRDPLEATPPFGTIAFSDTAAEIGVPLSQFQRIYRVGVALAWIVWYEAAVEYAGVRGVPLTELIAGPTLVIHAYSDGQMSSLLSRYETTQAQEQRTREQLQLSVLRHALDGTTVLGESEIEEALGISLAGEHLAIAVRTDRSPVESGLARLVARDVPASRVLDYRHGVRLWLLWISHPRRLDDVWKRGVHDALARSGTRAALGDPATGLEGLGSTGREALDAARLQDLLGDESAPVVHFSELRLESLLLSEPQRARRFVEVELGELDRDDSRCAVLRDTARQWLAAGSNIQTATALGVHEHTVRKRIDQIEALLGRPVTERRTELLVALRLRRLLHATSG